MSGHAPDKPVAPIPWQRKLARAWPVLLLGVVLAIAGTWRAGWLKTDAERRLDAWSTEGILVHEHQEVRAFLAQPGHAVRGIGDAPLRALLDKLDRAGAKGIYAVDITTVAAERQAEALVVTMPPGVNARQTVRYYAAEAQGLGKAPVVDRHEHYLVIAFK
jgi:hypothetical protein